MSYTKHNFVDNTPLYAAELNEMEDGIAEVESAVTAEAAARQAADAALQDAINVLNTDKIPRYSVRFSGSSCKGTREDDAVGMVAGVGVLNADGTTTTAQNDFDGIFDRPMLCGDFVQGDANNRMKMRINAYKGEPGYAEDGSNGNVWYEWKPFYYKIDPARQYYSIAFAPIPGYTLAPVFRDGNTKIYMPSYRISNTTKADSIAGTHIYGFSTDSAMAAARTYDADYAHGRTEEARFSEIIMMIVEFATLDFQTVMMGASSMRYVSGEYAQIAEDGANRIIVTSAVAGNYVVGQSICIATAYDSTDVNNYRVITSKETYSEDSTLTVINFDGDPIDISTAMMISSRYWKNGTLSGLAASSGSYVSNTDGKHPCIYRGHENPYCVWTHICNVMGTRSGSGTDADPYVYGVSYLDDPTQYPAAMTSAWCSANMIPMNYNIATADGYVKTLGYDSRYPFVQYVSEIGATSTTYYAAYFYFPRSAATAVIAGGGLNGGRTCSPFYCNLYNAPSGRSWHRSAELFVRQ